MSCWIQSSTSFNSTWRLCPFPLVALKVSQDKSRNLFEELWNELEEQQIDFMIKPITITIFKRLRNDDVGRWQEDSNCGGYCKECKNNKAQPINDHCSIFPILCHSWVLVLFSNLWGWDGCGGNSKRGTGKKKKEEEKKDKNLVLNELLRPILSLA